MLGKKYMNVVTDNIEAMEKKMKVSVIVPTRNRATYLEKMLESLLEQSVSKDEFEVIVIDNGSTDTTKNVCFQKKNCFPHFKYILEKKPGLHAGRNRGFVEAKGEYLLFADDDVIASSTWIEGIVEGFEHENVALVGGNIIPKFETSKPEWFTDFIINKNQFKIVSQLSVIWTSERENKTINPFHIFGCNFGVKREILEKCEGFHPDGMPSSLLMYRGDGESYVSHFVQQNGLKAMFVPKAAVYHVIPKERTSILYLRNRGKRDGISEMYSKLREEGIRGGIYCLRQSVKTLMSFTNYKKIYYKAFLRGEIYLFSYYVMYSRIREWISKRNYLET